MLQPKIISVTPVKPYKLLLEYEGETKIFDAAPYISGSWFEELHNAAYFNTVRLLPNGTGIVWPGGQDISPHELYELSEPAEGPLSPLKKAAQFRRVQAGEP